MKYCKSCNSTKSKSEFGKASNSSDGYKFYCKSCRSKKSKEQRLLKGGSNRIDRSIEDENNKICTKCLLLKPRSIFNHISWCKDCIDKNNRKYSDSKGIKPKFIPIVLEGKKQCSKCKEIKLLEEYSNSKKGRNGKSTYCKPCMSNIQLERLSKEERKILTQNYRDKNREWWRFLHRANQFNRVNRVKLASDGTVTKEFMILIYKTELCYYCRKFVDPSNRTMEHKQPLNKGGKHSKDNIEMCCVSCNSSKKDKTEEEYTNYLNNKN